MDYYTYCYLDENNKPYYIGKGRKRRAYDVHKGVELPPRERVLFLKTNLSESDALRYEEYYISVIGRIDLGTGPLQNKCNGGGGSKGMTGKPCPEEKKKRISESNKRTKAKGISEETRKKMSEAAKKRCTPEWREGRRQHCLKMNKTREHAEKQRKAAHRRKRGEGAKFLKENKDK